MELMIARRRLLTQKTGPKRLIPADDPNDPTKYYYLRGGLGSPVEYDADEQAFIKTGRSIVYSAQTVMDGQNSKLYVAPYDMTVTYSVDYKNIGTSYGLRFYVNSTIKNDIHGTADSEWHTFTHTIDLYEGDYIRILYYDKIYWRNQMLFET